MAQTDAGDAGDVVMTRRPDPRSNAPPATVDCADIEYHGAVNVESVLNRLPRFAADAEENAPNGASGTANINPRNVGPNRVTVSIDGQRMTSSQAVDLTIASGILTSFGNGNTFPGIYDPMGRTIFIGASVNF